MQVMLMPTYWFWYFFLWLYPVLTPAPPQTPVSTKEQAGKARVDSLLAQAKQYHFYDIHKAKRFMEQARAAALKYNYLKGLASAERGLGFYWTEQYEYHKAIPFYRKALDIYTKLQDRPNQAKLLNDIGAQYVEIGNYGMAMQHFEQALAIVPPDGQDEHLAKILGNTGITYERESNYQQAHHYYVKVMRMVEQGRVKIDLGDAYNNVGRIFRLLGRPRESLEYYNQALQAHRHVDDQIGVALDLFNRSLVCIEMKNFTQALMDLEAASKFFQQKNDQKSLASCLTSLGWLFTESRQFGKARGYYQQAVSLHKEMKNNEGLYEVYGALGQLYSATKQWHQALHYQSQALAIAKELKYSPQIAELYYALSQTNRELGQFTQALRYLEQSYAYKDSLYNEKNLVKIQQLQSQYEIEKRENRIANLHKDRQIKQLELARTARQYRQLWLGTLLLVIITSVVCYLLIRIRKTQRILRKQTEEIQTQYAQLNEANARLSASEQALARSNATKDRFFSILVHDLKNPLVSLQEMLALFRMKLTSEAQAGLQPYLDQLEYDFFSVLNLVNNVLHWSLSQQESITKTVERVDVAATVQHAATLLQTTAHLKQISLEVSLPQEAFACTDKNMVEFIARNLISNALKFTPPQGKVTIALHLHHKELILSVTDTGPGVKGEQLGELMEQENMLLNTQGGWGKGTGLGLMLSNKFTKLLQGRLWAESEPNKGAIFYVAIPV